MKFLVLQIGRGSLRTHQGMQVSVWKQGLGKVSALGQAFVPACGVAGAVWGFQNLAVGLPLSV